MNCSIEWQAVESNEKRNKQAYLQTNKNMYISPSIHLLVLNFWYVHFANGF